MPNEQVSKEAILKALQEMNLNINERFDKIDSEIGRRIAAMEVKIDSIEKIFDSLGKELGEQYYSLGRRLDFLQLQMIKHDGEQNKDNKQMTAKEVLDAIENMSNEERWKLLDELYFKYYNKAGHEYSPLDLDY